MAESQQTKFISNSSWDYICTLLKTEFAKYTETKDLDSLFNIFKTVKIVQGETDTKIIAEQKEDVITLIGGSNVTLTASAENKSVTISSIDTDTKYTITVGEGDNKDKIGIKNLSTNEVVYITVPYATNAEKAQKDASGNIITTTYAPITSPTFTGVPKAPTPADSSSDTTIATTAFVHSLVDKITGIRLDGTYNSLTELKTQHPTGELGVIYLVKNSKTGGNDACDEYYWNNKLATPDYEFFGTTAVDLEPYLKKEDSMTNDEILLAWNTAVPVTSSSSEA